MLPFFIFLFKFFYEIYEEFLVHLIAGQNLAINEQSKKFWYGIDDRISMRKNRGEWGSIEI